MTKDEKTFLYGVVIGMLIMSQIAGILGNAGYEIPKRYTIAKLWSRE
jgi:tetrahydromethanopterin S-methyltransferase subunit B